MKKILLIIFLALTASFSSQAQAQYNGIVIGEYWIDSLIYHFYVYKFGAAAEDQKQLIRIDSVSYKNYLDKNYYTNLPSTSTPDYVISIDNTTGLIKKSSASNLKVDWSNVQNKPSIPGALSYNYNVTRPINSTSFTPSTTKSYRVTYTATISCTATIGSTASGKLELQYYNGTSWIGVGQIFNSNTVTLAIVLNSVNSQTTSITCEFPANTQLRLVPTIVGTTTITYVTGTEIY